MIDSEEFTKNLEEEMINYFDRSLVEYKNYNIGKSIKTVLIHDIKTKNTLLITAKRPT